MSADLWLAGNQNDAQEGHEHTQPSQIAGTFPEHDCGQEHAERHFQVDDNDGQGGINPGQTCEGQAVLNR